MTGRRLTSLQVALDGGAHGLFATLCHNPSGTASATLTNQNGDKTVTAPAKRRPYRTRRWPMLCRRRSPWRRLTQR